MPTFIVSVGYEWIVPCCRDVEVDAIDADHAGTRAFELAASDPEFWTDAVECDGESDATEVFEVRSVEPEET